jgi:hypothetical protein
LSWIRTYDPSVLVDEDISLLRPRGHCEGKTGTTELKILVIPDIAWPALHSVAVPSNTVQAWLLTSDLTCFCPYQEQLFLEACLNGEAHKPLGTHHTELWGGLGSVKEGREARI